MPLELSQLNLGKVDGKHEYLAPQSDRDQLFYDAFLVPDTVDPNRLNNSDIFYIEGFRGTGKTSLLRWHAETQRKKGAYTDFVLFKSDLTEQQRLQISREVGISWTDIESKGMEVSQDFKAAWRWFIHHKIGEALVGNPALSESPDVSHYVRLLALKDPNVFTKILGFLPKLEGANVKVKSDLQFFALELGGDFRKDGSQGKTTLDALDRKLDEIAGKLSPAKPIYIYFDELEVFFHSLEQYHRDQRMVRDLLFSVGSLNDLFRNKKVPIHIIGAVRSEIIDSMGALGQEVDRLVHDRGFNIAWHYAKRSRKHPLLQIIERKIWASEQVAGVAKSEDAIAAYFPNEIAGQQLEARLLDGSFYKPRDIVWRLTIAQKQFPHADKFSEQILQETEIEYSSKLWDEIKYELSATYADEEIEIIELVLSGTKVGFDLDEMKERFDRAEQRFSKAKGLLSRRTVSDILADLYRLGAVGNTFRVGSTGTQIRNRWSFRGDPSLLPDKRMTLHPALAKRLSAISPRRRGTRGGR